VSEHPEKLAAGLRAEKAEAERASSAIHARLALIDDKLRETETNQAALLPLYLFKKFKEELLDAQKAELDKAEADLRAERAKLVEHIADSILTEESIAAIESEVAEIRDGLELATFEDKRRYFDWLRVRGTLAIENAERVAYISCRFGKQRLSVAATSPS
jgi:hypothetical protein